MTITLDGKTLKVKSISEGLDLVGTSKDRWEAGIFKREQIVFGGVRVWTLECHENGVAWADSVVPHFMDKAKANTVVTFVVDEAPAYSVNRPVYIMAVNMFVDIGDLPLSYRTFTLTLQEAA